MQNQSNEINNNKQTDAEKNDVNSSTKGNDDVIISGDKGEAFNFMSSSVDSRTGTYNLQIPIIDTVANNGLGPRLSVSITHNPLNVPPRDKYSSSFLPFGCDWSGITVLTSLKDNYYSGMLPTGESITVHYEYNSFGASKFRRVDHTVNNVTLTLNNEYLNLLYEDGMVDSLKGFRIGSQTVLALVKRYDPSGHYININWDVINDTLSLKSITDESSSLLEITKSSSGDSQVYTFKSFPEKSKSYSTKLTTNAKKILYDVSPDVEINVQALTRIENHIDGGQDLVSDLQYKEIIVERFGGTSYGSLLFLTQIKNSTGMSETISYYEKKLRYPIQTFGWPTQTWENVALPAVYRHTIDPGFNAQPIYKKYIYGADSYLGGFHTAPYSISPYIIYDNFLMEQDFSENRYVCEELVIDKDDTIVFKKVEKIYNAYHLLISEQITFPQAVYTNAIPCSLTTTFTYNITLNKKLTAQPVNYRYPVKVTKEWLTGGEQQERRIEEHFYTYNNRGHCTQEIYDGIQIDREYLYVWPDKNLIPDNDLNKPVCMLKSERKTLMGNEKGSNDTQVTVIEYDFSSYPAQNLNNDDNCPRYFHYITGSVSYIILNDGRKLEQVEIQNIYHFERSSEFARIEKSISSIPKDCQLKTTHEFTISSNTYDEIQTIISYRWDSDVNDWKSLDSHYNMSKKITRCRWTGLILSETDSLGNKSEFNYNNRGQLILTIENVGSSYETRENISYEYNTSQGNIVTKEDSSGNILKCYTDGLRRVIKLSRNSPTYPVFGEFVFKKYYYDQLNRIIRVDDFDGYLDHISGKPFNMLNITDYMYDSWGQITETAYMAEDTYFYSEIVVADPINLTIETFRITNAFEITCRKKYYLNIHRQVLKEVSLSPHGEVIPGGLIEYKYDGIGRLSKVIDQEKYETSYQYDNLNRITTCRFPDNVIHGYTYVSENTPSPISTVYAKDLKTNKLYTLGYFEYDPIKRLISETVGGRTKKYEYDSFHGSPSKITDSNGKASVYDYIPELNNSLKSCSLGGLQTNNLLYDKFGRVVSVRQVDSYSFTIQRDASYSPEGYLLSDSSILTRGRGIKDNYSYSVMGKVVAEMNTEGKNKKYFYNKNGILVGILDDSSDIMVNFDNYGNLINCKNIKHINSVPLSVETSITLDEFQRESLRIVQNDTDQVYQYAIRTIYDTKNRKTKEYIWIYNGWKYSASDYLSGNLDAKARIITYQYNERNRLIGKTSTLPVSNLDILPEDGHGMGILAENFTYDIFGNVKIANKTYRDIKGQTTTKSFVFNYQNELDPTQLTSINDPFRGVISFGYDNNGRVTNDGIFSYAYNNKGQMEVAKNDGSLSHYYYDGLGRLAAWESVMDWQSPSGIRTTFYYNKDGICDGVIRSKTNSGAKIDSQVFTFLHDTPLSTWGQKNNFYGVDSHDSVVAEFKVNSGDQPITAFSYSAYGESSRTVEAPGFNGELRDSITGGTNLGNGYRVFKPSSLRFYSPDSTSHFGINAINPYAYCAGDPVNFVDPSGHSHQVPSTTPLDYIIMGFQIYIGVLCALPGGPIVTGLSVVFGIASGACFIAADAVRGDNQNLSTTLNAVGLGIGLLEAMVAPQISEIDMFPRFSANLKLRPDEDTFLGRIDRILRFGLNGGNKLPAIQELDPRLIRFTQSTTRSQGKFLEDLTNAMKLKGFVVDDNLMSVVRWNDGTLSSLDNTRLAAAKRAGVNIKAVVYDSEEKITDEAMKKRFEFKRKLPETWGEAVQFRIGKQKAEYVHLYSEKHGSLRISVGNDFALNERK